MSSRIQEVVLALDGTPQAPRAVPLAQAMIEAFGAPVTVVAVTAEGNHTVEALMQLQVAGLTIHGPRVRQDQLIGGDSASALAAFTASLGDALLCVATHGRDHLVGSPLGDVASELLRWSNLPIAMIGPVAAAQPEGPVVACVDGSPGSEGVLPVAALFARSMGRPLDVLCVAEAVPDALGGRPTHRRFGPDGDAGEYVARVASSIEADGLSIETIVVADPIGPLEGLLAYLSAHPAGLVAVATHAREGFTRLVHRSMTAQLVDRCPCPVVALPIRDWQQ